MKVSIFSRQRSEKASFEELVTPHVEGLYRLAYHYTQNRCDAEDLVQDLLIKLFKRVDELREVDSLRPWLAKSLYHLFIDKTRQAKRQPIDHAESLESDDTNFSPHASRSSEPHREDDLRDIEYALAQLNEEQRQVIVLHDVESYTLGEVSLIYDIPIGTLKSRLHRARAQLRKLLTDGTF